MLRPARVEAEGWGGCNWIGRSALPRGGSGAIAAEAGSASWVPSGGAAARGERGGEEGDGRAERGEI